MYLKRTIIVIKIFYQLKLNIQGVYYINIYSVF